MMMQQVKRAAVVCVLGMSFVWSVAKADDIKIGTVDMQKALHMVDAGKKAKAQLDKEVESKKKEIQTEEAAIKKASEEFRKKSLVLSEDARAKKQNELQERVMKLQELAGRSQMELQQKERELTEPLINKLRGVISDVAKQKGYGLILEKNENTVLYSMDKDDLTEEVISMFNKQNKG